VFAEELCAALLAGTRELRRVLAEMPECEERTVALRVLDAALAAADAVPETPPP
jgi:hypothetical protein